MAKTNKKTKTAPKRYVPRQTRKFQLRHNNPIDVHVGEILDYSRSQRREVTVIRDGVRLLWALENNDLNVLFELFPHLKDQFIPGGTALLDQIQSLFLNSQVLPQAAPALPHAGLKSLKAPTFELPTFDDDDELPTLVTNKNMTNDPGLNFIGGLMNLR